MNKYKIFQTVGRDVKEFEVISKYFIILQPDYPTNENKKYLEAEFFNSYAMEGEGGPPDGFQFVAKFVLKDFLGIYLYELNEPWEYRAPVELLFKPEYRDLYWQGFGSPKYVLEIATDSAFNGIILTVTTTEPHCFFTGDKMIPPGSYYARVRNYYKDKTWSATLQFEVV